MKLVKNIMYYHYARIVVRHGICNCKAYYGCKARS